VSGEIPDLSRADVEALQLERLRESLRRAEQVPHYRAAFAAAGVGADDLASLADLARFPFTTKADLRENYPFGMFAGPREQVARIHASSGTTGRPTVVGYTRDDIDTWAEVMARSIRAAGGGPVTCCTWPTATGCSRAGSVRTTAPSGSAARWCRSAAA
jgi:phenylacetate-CoA ligase